MKYLPENINTETNRAEELQKTQAEKPNNHQDISLELMLHNLYNSMYRTRKKIDTQLQEETFMFKKLKDN